MANRIDPWVLSVLSQSPHITQSYLNEVDSFWREGERIRNESTTGSLIGAIVVAVALSLGILVGIFYYFRDRRRKKKHRIAEEESEIVEMKLRGADGVSTEIVELQCDAVHELPRGSKIVTIHYRNAELDANSQEILEMGDTQVVEHTTINEKGTLAQAQGQNSDRTRFRQNIQPNTIRQAGIETPASPIPKAPAEYYDRDVYRSNGTS
jgi:hypothetical protein